MFSQNITIKKILEPLKAVSLHEQTNKKYIKFGLNFKIDGEQNQEIYFGDLHEFSYDCNYDAFGSTGPTEYDVEFVQRNRVQNINNFIFFDSVSLFFNL